MTTLPATSEGARPASPPRRSIADLLQPLEDIAAHSPNLIANHDASFEVGGEPYELPRYVYVGPEGGSTPIRIGIFAGVYGDEVENVHSLILFIRLLEAKPDLAAGYCLFFYPVCNPSGFEDGTRLSRAGKDLNREFWNQSQEPEVLRLQSEIVSHAFDRMISLYANDTDNHFFGIERGGALTGHLIEPALEAVEKFSRDYDQPVFRSRTEITRKGVNRILSAPPGLGPKPFEIILETAKSRATWQMVAVLNILDEYRKFIAYAPNL